MHGPAAWVMPATHVQCMGSVWIMWELCTDCVWAVHGLCMENDSIRMECALMVDAWNMH